MDGSEKRSDLPYYVKRDWDMIETQAGIRYEPKRPALRMLGKPPWELELTAFDDLIPDEASDLVGALVWRGRRFVSEDEEWELRGGHIYAIVRNGVRYVRCDEKDWDSESLND